MNPLVLITQKLNEPERILLDSYHQIRYMEVPMLETQWLNFMMPKEQVDYLLITSQNAVTSMLCHEKVRELKKYPVICVGRQTKQLLLSEGWEVQYASDYAEDLIPVFKQIRIKRGILFLSGNLRSRILPHFMAQSQIHYYEIMAYRTILTPHLIHDFFDAVVFFSPSAVVSFCRNHSVKGKRVFCIGTTTARALKENVRPMLPVYPNRKETLILCAEQLSREC